MDTDCHSSEAVSSKERIQRGEIDALRLAWSQNAVTHKLLNLSELHVEVQVSFPCNPEKQLSSLTFSDSDLEQSSRFEVAVQGRVRMLSPEV